MLDGLDIVCGCCELCLGIADALASRREEKPGPAKAAQTARLTRTAREERRGVRLVFQGKRISEIDFIGGAAAGKRASEMSDMELKRLALALPHRTARFAVRHYLRHRKAGRVPAPGEPAVRR